MSDQENPSVRIEDRDSIKLSEEEYDYIILHRQHMAKVNHLEFLSTTFRNELPEELRESFDNYKEKEIKASFEASPLTACIVQDREKEKRAEENLISADSIFVPPFDYRDYSATMNLETAKKHHKAVSALNFLEFTRQNVRPTLPDNRKVVFDEYYAAKREEILKASKSLRYVEARRKKTALDKKKLEMAENTYTVVKKDLEELGEEGFNALDALEEWFEKKERLYGSKTEKTKKRKRI